MNAVVTERTLLPFWHSVVHLVRFDLRRFRLLVTLIVGLELAYAAFVEWSLHFAPVVTGGRFGGAFGTEESAFLGGVLGLATMLATAAIVQADRPSDDRAFWRTRPIAPLALATAKLTTFALLFVALPAVVNAWRLAAYGASIIAMAAATLEILVEAGILVAFTWALALATRTLPRFFAALGALVVGFYLSLAALAFWMSRADGAAVGSIGFGFEGAGIELGPAPAIAFTVIAFAILVAHYQFRRRLASMAAGLVLIAAAAVFPERDGTPAAPPELARLVDGRLRLPDGIGVPQSWFAQGGAGWPAYLAGRIEFPPLPVDVSAAVALRDTQVVVDGRRIPVRGTEQCCGGRGPVAVITAAPVGPAMPAAESPIVFGLPAPLVPEVAGRRIALQSGAEVNFARHHLVGAIPLRPGAAFRTDRYLLEFLGLEPARRFLLLRFARFPRFASGRTEGISLFLADPARARVMATTPAWRLAPANAASGTYEWAQGRKWSGRFQVLLTGIAPVPPDAQLLIVETAPAGVTRTTLSAADVEVRAPRIE